MKINCLSCGFKIDLDDAYDDYTGQIKCYACSTLMQIKTVEGKLASAGLAQRPQRSPQSDFEGS